jgi:excisionase family DNA binding protein
MFTYLDMNSHQQNTGATSNLRLSRATANAETPSTEAQFLLVEEVAKILRVGINRAYELVKSEIPHRKFGNSYRIPRAAFTRWLERQS